MANFKWLRNPTLANGKPTWYGSHRGKDSGDGGDGSATNPFKTIAQITSVATAGDNIMLDDGIWSQERTLNNRSFNWWGNGRTEINSNTVILTVYGNEEFYFLHIKLSTITIPGGRYFKLFYSIIENVSAFNAYQREADIFFAKNSIILNCNVLGHYGGVNCQLENSLVIGGNTGFSTKAFTKCYIKNCIFTGTIGAADHYGVNCDYNNYTTLSIPTTNGANSHSINDASTGQTIADYFNSVALGDYTAKVGSANLGAGYQKHDIGFSLGLTMYANDPCFLEVNGAVLKNVYYENECWKIKYRDRSFVSFTATTMILDPAYRSAVDDEYNDLILATVSGTGSGQKTTITDYDATTGEITFVAFGDAIDADTRVTISGLIITGDKYFGGSYKIALNHLLANFGYNELNPEEWTEWMAVNPLVSSFGLKFSDFDNLSTKDWFYFGANGQTLSDGTYGDADDSHTIALGKPIHIAYVKAMIPLIPNVV